MSAPDPGGISRPPLLVVIDPVARLLDGESVRIARDVLRAGSPGLKVCLPQNAEEMERALLRRGSRRPVVVGDDRALLRAVTLLHRERELGEAALSVVPVGAARDVALARGLGVPPDAVTAARTALAGVTRRLDLLIDDSGGVVLGGLRIPHLPRPGTAAAAGGGAGGAGTRGYDRYDAAAGHGSYDGYDGYDGYGGYGDGYGGHLDGYAARAYGGPGRCGPGADPDDGGADGAADPYGGDEAGEPAAGPAGVAGLAAGARAARPLTRTRDLVRRARGPLAGRLRVVRALRGERTAGPPPAQRLRVEADGELLADLDRPVAEVSVVPSAERAGLAHVTVRPEAAPPYALVSACARAVTVSGPDFHYRADALVGGPVRVRTWTALAGAWRLTLPG